MSAPVDLLVVGGGPVGLGTAVLAAEAGMRVVVAEQRAYPVDKACGEGLMPTALGLVQALGADPEGCAIGGIAYLTADGSVRASARFRGGTGRGVRRLELSRALRARTLECGVELRQLRVDAVEQTADDVRAGGVRARWAVAADGLHSPLRRSLGLAAPERGPARYGLRRHYALAPWSDEVEVSWTAGAEAYVTPVGPDLVGVALLSTRSGRGYDELLAGFPALRARLGDAVGGPVRGAGPLRQGASDLRAGRVLLAGDAAGYVDALTGEGIAVGLRGAGELVRCLVRDEAEAYAARAARSTRRTRVLTLGLLSASRVPPVRSALVPAAARLPRVFERVVGALA
ncbi:flavin-dependent dehydrogenase [Motilibacter rhizosphaerae]|uniref:Flavin-dependent dehydrogenase n=1 Tax=Motilibacter rhizosphaerae TaxID=598652 RepID=A0A4Q7NBJ8_9ACTN|nr:FAD-dependent monooxygenase [Motilibacter rhizosphaerae]RZS80200.1 flavin-dependent dehydrogenase [Motilibacter rhizosphaerae]